MSVTNLVRNPSFEVNTTRWAVDVNCALSRSNAAAYVGTWSLALTASAAGNMSARINGADAEAVTVGTTYTASAYFRAAATARNVNVTIRWYDGSNALLSSSVGSQVADTTTGWTRATVTAVAPAGAVKAGVLVQVASAASAEVHRVDGVQLEAAATASAYFDGDTPDAGANSYEWNGTAHDATSTAYTMVVSAVVQNTAPPRVLVTVTDLRTDGDPVTVYRIVDGAAVPVRGAIGVLPDGAGVLVVTDLSAPFGVAVQYRADQTDVTTGAVSSASSSVVTLTASGPWVSLPITGEAVQLTIEDWPEKKYAARASVIAVAGRATPIVISDKRLAASSTLTVITRTREDLMALRELLAAGDVIQVRPVCGAVEAEYLAVFDVTEQRHKANSLKTDGGTPAGSDWRRHVVMDVQVVDEPPLKIPATGDTLADLHAFVGGDTATLNTLATATFPAPATLLTIAQTPMGS